MFFARHERRSLATWMEGDLEKGFQDLVARCAGESPGIWGR